MSKTVCLLEYERLSERDRRLEPGDFSAIQAYIGDCEEQKIPCGLKMGCQKGALYVTASNYVGLIAFPGDFKLEILPKLHLSWEGEDEEARRDRTRQFFFHMLTSCGVIPSRPSTHTGLDRREQDMMECFYDAFVAQARRLVRQGLASGYHPHTENQPFLRGRLEINGHLRYNLAHRERFYVTYEVFDQDRPENRLLKTALTLVGRRTGSLELKRQVRGLLDDMDTIPLSVHPDIDFQRCTGERSVRRYDCALSWCRLFLQHESFTTYSGDNGTQAVLFPMERIFQDYVAGELERCLPAWSISTQEHRHHLFYQDGQGKFRLTPDIVARHRQSGHVVVMDTKWKKLDRTKQGNGIAQADLYQMYAYGKKYRASRMVLLYPDPGEEGVRELDGLRLHSGTEEREPVEVLLRLVRLDRLEKELIPALNTELEEVLSS